MRSKANAASSYSDAQARAEGAFKDSINGGLPAVVIAKAIASAIETKKPRVRYRVGMPAFLFPVLQSLLGERIFRSIMKSAFKL